jgi:hypothetical protein
LRAGNGDRKCRPRLRPGPKAGRALDGFDRMAGSLTSKTDDSPLRASLK